MNEEIKQLGRKLEQALTDEEAKSALEAIGNLPLKDIKDLAQNWDIFSLRKTKADYLDGMYKHVYLGRKTHAIITKKPMKPAISQLD